MTKEYKKELLKLAISIIVVLAIIFIINKFFLGIIRVNGDSMNPAVENNDIILINKAIDDDAYERFDIVAFKYVYDNRDIYIKRIIALPNETIEIKDNVIYVNDEKLEEYYGAFSDIESSPDIASYFSDYPKTKLGVDEYFVLGDNRYASDDSRNFGPITGDTILGKAVFRVWKFNSIGSLKYQ